MFTVEEPHTTVVIICLEETFDNVAEFPMKHFQHRFVTDQITL